MESSQPPAPASAASLPSNAIAPDTTLSPLSRIVAIFVRPASAWSGLRERAQWWIPLLMFVAVTAIGTAIIYPRAIAPDAMSKIEEQVQSGNIPPEQVERFETMYTGPVAVTIGVCVGAVVTAAILFLVASLVWFAIGFVLGAPFKYRYALEVTTWSSLIMLLAQLLVYSLAWVRESMHGLHVGFGILLPEAGPDDRILKAVSTFLDWIGPLEIWRVAVAVLGAAYFSGAPRKNVAWALGTLYLVCGLVAAGLGALFPTAW